MSVDETQPKLRRVISGSASSAAADAGSLKGSVVSSSLSTDDCSSLEELTELEDNDMEDLESGSMEEVASSDGGGTSCSDAPSVTPSAVLRSTPFKNLKERFDN